MKIPPVARVSAEIDRACTALQTAGLDFALLSSMPNVTYVSGWEMPAAVGPVADFSGSLPFGLVLLSAHDKAGWLLVPDLFAVIASRQARVERVQEFGVFGHVEAVDPVRSLQEALWTVLREAGVTEHAVVGIESRSLPVVVERLLLEQFPALKLGEAAPYLEEARRIKTSREIELLRRAAATADIGQSCLVELAYSAGQVDVEIWAELVGRMEKHVGHPLLLTGELVTGARTATVAPGGPIGQRIVAGDIGLLDISPRVDGYWADCTNTVVFGTEPTPEQKRYFTAARDACEAAIESLRPGVRACDVDAIVRKVLTQHGFSVAHYSGHQLGTSVNERPRLVPYDDSIIEAGMIFAVEPGVYAGKGGLIGARAEKIALVTESGPELLSQFPWGMEL